MRPIQVVRLIVVAVILISSWSPARAQTDLDSRDIHQATAVANKGDTARALAMVEEVLTRSPENLNALFRSAQFNFQMDNLVAARGRLERLVKLSGSYFSAWESMVQVTQAQGDLARRNEAIEQLKISIKSAIDPDIRRKVDFIRERIRVGGQDILAADYFERGGSDFTRLQFAIGDPRMSPDTGLLLRTDALTTENWAATALLAQDKQLFHLDLVEPKAEGGEKVAVYQYYVGEPDYDTVRAKVMQILHGEIQPLSGEPGSLAGIAKQ